MKPSSTATERITTGSVIEEEIKLETQAAREGAAHYRRLADAAIRRGTGASLKPAERLLIHWFPATVAAIKEEQRGIRRGEPDIGRDIYGRVLVMIDAERAAVVTMHECISHCMTDYRGIPISRLSYSIGRAIFAEINFDNFRESYREQLKLLERRVRAFTPCNVNWWAKKTMDDPVWERRVCTHLGTRLIWLLMSVASTTPYTDEYDFTPAFEHKRVWVKKHKSLAVLRISDSASAIIDEGHEKRQYMRPKYPPMIVPPYAWKHDNEGGYARIRTPFISKPSKTQKSVIADASKAGKLDTVYKCLNAVNATPWHINTNIVDIMRQVWDAGGGAVGVPHRDDFPKPPAPDDFDENEEAKNAWKHSAFLTYRRNMQLRSDRKIFLSKLYVADQMAGRSAIWFPHQFDFRGRMYPIPPYLNHQGDDISRGLLMFADAKDASSDRAKFWLLVHAANCYGIDKVSFNDRVKWVEQHWSEINEAVANPVGDEWWKQADKPWQFLAAAMALFDEDLAAHLPVQVDGTCNGLQHYAAMSRNAEDAAVVNLIPGDVPADVYTDVSNVTARLVRADAEKGIPEAVVLNGEIDRKLVKQTVMTSVYGVTAAGARQQVYGKLDKLNVDEQQRYKAAMYVSKLVLRSMDEVCHGATAIMAWLKDIARTIALKHKSLVQWTTPIGFPVVQPYRNRKRVRTETLMGKIDFPGNDDKMPPASGRHIKGFAPNYIHSIDATHMLATALECHTRRIAFAAVHDSYWTHAADMEVLSKVIRQQFIDMHQRPLMIELVNELRGQFAAIDLPDPPEQGNLDLEAIAHSPYFFS